MVGRSKVEYKINNRERKDQMVEFNGLGMGLGNLSRLSKAKTRSISAENFDGAKGKGGMATEGTGANAGRDLGRGWKISPSIMIEANQSYTIAEIDGPGVIQHIWMTCFPAHWRTLILRMYWDGEENPSIEVPFGDFFSVTDGMKDVMLIQYQLL